MTEDHQRASDAERQAAVDALRQHVADGRLTLEEFEERAEEAYQARTMGELLIVSRDLPATTGGALAPAPPLDHRISAFLGDETRNGRWRVPERLELSAVLGDVKVDLREAELPGAVDIEARAILGDVRIYVPALARVELTGTSYLGSKKLRSGAETSRSGPMIRVHATAVLGDVVVDVQTPGERMRDWVSRLGG